MPLATSAMKSKAKIPMKIEINGSISTFVLKGMLQQVTCIFLRPPAFLAARTAFEACNVINLCCDVKIYPEDSNDLLIAPKIGSRTCLRNDIVAPCCRFLTLILIFRFVFFDIVTN